MNNENVICPLCKNEVIKDRDPQGRDSYLYKCNRCGNYHLSMTAEVVINNPKYADSLFIISGYVRNQSEKDKEVSFNSNNIEEVINNYYPKTVLEKINHLLLYFEKKTEHFGFSIRSVSNLDYPIAYAKNKREYNYILSAMNKLGYIDITADRVFVSLTVLGFERLQTLKETPINSKHCFIASSFKAEYHQLYDDAIAPALEATGFSPIWLPNKEHNHLIDDEIIGGINKSRFIIANLSEGNQGAYFEAGYAIGRKIEVIMICNENDKNNRHFDVDHRNTIFYKTPKELENRLIERIEATIY